MTKETDVIDGLYSHLVSLTFSPAVPIAMEGKAFTVPAGPYLRAETRFNTPLRPFIADESPDLLRGIMQVTVNYPGKDTGIRKPVEMAGTVADHFAKGTRIPVGSTEIRIEARPQVEAMTAGDTHLEVPVSIYWQVYI